MAAKTVMATRAAARAVAAKVAVMTAVKTALAARAVVVRVVAARAVAVRVVARVVVARQAARLEAKMAETEKMVVETAEAAKAEASVAREVVMAVEGTAAERADSMAAVLAEGVLAICILANNFRVGLLEAPVSNPSTKALRDRTLPHRHGFRNSGIRAGREKGVGEKEEKREAKMVGCSAEEVRGAGLGVAARVAAAREGVLEVVLAASVGFPAAPLELEVGVSWGLGLDLEGEGLADLEKLEVVVVMEDSAAGTESL